MAGPQGSDRTIPTLSAKRWSATCWRLGRRWLQPTRWGPRPALLPSQAPKSLHRDALPASPSDRQPARSRQEGYTALHLAALCGKPSLVSLLLAAGADPTTRTATGKTAAECAEQFAGADEEAAASCVALLLAAPVPEPASGGGYAPLAGTEAEAEVIGEVPAAERRAGGGGPSLEDASAGEGKLCAARVARRCITAFWLTLMPRGGERHTETFECLPKGLGTAALADLAAARASGVSSIGFVPDEATARALGFGGGERHSDTD